MLPIDFGNVMLLMSLMLVGYTFDYKTIDNTPIVKKAEGRGQKAEGSNMVGASDPLPIAGHQIHNLVGALNPCSLRSPEALRHRPSAFCLRTSAFPGKKFRFKVSTFTGTRTADMFDSLTHQPKNQILNYLSWQAYDSIFGLQQDYGSNFSIRVA